MSRGSAMAAALTAKDNARAKQAKQLFRQGQYDAAAEIFSSLSSDYPDRLVFTRNLGACYYYLRRADPALSNLRDYLRRSQDIAPDDRAEVEGWMAEMEKLRSQSAATATARPPATVTGVAAVPPGPVSGEPPIGAAVPSAPAAQLMVQPPVMPTPFPAGTTEAQSPPRSYNKLAWIAGGAGIACLAAGGIFTGLAVSKFSSTESQYDPSAESAGKTYAGLQWVGYGLGVAGGATAAVLFILDARTNRSVALSPMLGEGFAGASAIGTY